MTGDTTPQEKVRAVFLAAIMVASVFAVGAAGFAGSAAALSADDASNVDLSAGNTASQTITFTLDNGIDYNNGDETFSGARISVSELGLDLTGVTLTSATDSTDADVSGALTASADTANDLITVAVTDEATPEGSISVELSADYDSANSQVGEKSLTIKSAENATVSDAAVATTPFAVQGLSIVSVSPSDATSVIGQGTD